MNNTNLNTSEQKRKERKRQVVEAWNNANREKVKLYGREFYKRNAEQRKARSREYYNLHMEERTAYSKAYYQRKKIEREKYINGDKTAAITKSQKYSLEHKHEIYKYKIYEYTPRSISEIQAEYPTKVKEMIEQYPFETCEKMIKTKLFSNNIYPSQNAYDDCYEACMFAYLYSICRCAKMGYSHVFQYTRKMVNIYIVGAIVVYNETMNICKFNHFRELRIDTQNNLI